MSGIQREWHLVVGPCGHPVRQLWGLSYWACDPCRMIYAATGPSSSSPAIPYRSDDGTSRGDRRRARRGVQTP